MFIFHLYFSFGEMSVQVSSLFFRLFFFLLLNLKRSLYVLDNNLLSDIYIKNKYFLPVCGFSFHSLNNIFRRVEVLFFFFLNLTMQALSSHTWDLVQTKD